jgi:hypothetical protein
MRALSEMMRGGELPPSGEPPLLNPKRTLAALLLFGVAFGFIEAAVVVYLRELYGPIHQRIYPDAAADALFPILLPEDLRNAGPAAERAMQVELMREAATLFLLAAAGLAIGRNFRERLAGFVIAFGIWDIFFYVFLKVILNWPASLWTWDLLFLLPVPWVGPVITPLLISVAMITAGVLTLWREASGRPLRPGAGHWLAVLGGGVVVVLAFCWDWRHIAARGEPASFPWPLFLLGLGLALAGFLHAFWKGTAVGSLVRGGVRELAAK